MSTTRNRVLGLAVGAATLLSGFSIPAVAMATDLQPVIHYSFDAAPADGVTIANEGTAADSDATLQGDAAVFEDGMMKLDGGSGGTYVSVPTNAINGEKDITISVWLRNNNGGGNTSAAYIGNASTSNGYFLLNPQNPSGYVKMVMTTATAASPNTSPWNTELGPGRTGNVGAGKITGTSDLAMYTAVIDGEDGTMTTYFNGKKIEGAEATGLAGGLTAYGDDLVAMIGHSAYADPKDKIDVDDYAVYDSVLTAEDVQDLYVEHALPLAEQSVDSVMPESATADFTLPTTAAGLSVTWEVTDGTAITINGDSAIVTRPAASDEDDVVTLRAAFHVSGETKTKDYTVTVPREMTSQEKVDADLDAIEIADADDIRTNFSVPTVGDNGSQIVWTVKDAGATEAKVVDGVNETSDTVQVTRPAAGESASKATLTATVSADGVSSSKDFEVTVQPLPADAGQDEAYVWAFFTGEGVGGEKISLAASKGNNALDWNTLNDGTPLFTSEEGEQGLRDPFIFKSKDGDKFYLLATDLKIDGRADCNGLTSFAGAQANGSQYIEIWESDDLVNWSDQRHVKVSTAHAGNTWAPEAYWDDEIGKYVVYWASNLYDDEDPDSRTSLTYNRMMYVTTDDFVNFSEPQVWIDVDRRGQAGAGSIDATVQKEGDVYYRVYKDENTMTLREERSTDLLATVSGSYPGTTGADDEWVTVGTEIGNGQSNGYGGTFSAGEGPSLFKANEGDVNGYQYYLFADQPNYHGGPNHYVPMATTDISDASKWEVIGDEMPEANFPTNSDGGRPRHGTVLPVTRSQYETVLAAYAEDIAVESVQMDEVAAVEPGVAPTLPAQATLTMKDGSTKTVDVVWDDIDPAQYADPGTFTVEGVAQDDVRTPVSATITVIDPNPVTAIESIAVTRQPNKVKYEVGDDFDATGLEVTATEKTEGSDETTTRVLDASEYTVSAPDLSKAGTVTVTVTLNADPSKTASFEVTVAEAQTPDPGKDDNTDTPDDGDASQDGGSTSQDGNASQNGDETLPDTGSSIVVVLAVAVLSMLTAGGITVLSRRRV